MPCFTLHFVVTKLHFLSDGTVRPDPPSSSFYLNQHNVDSHCNGRQKILDYSLNLCQIVVTTATFAVTIMNAQGKLLESLLPLSACMGGILSIFMHVWQL